MTALRAVVRISGQTSAGKATLVVGDATGELRFTPGELTVDIDTTVIPPRVEVGLPAGVSALLQSLLDTESSTGYVGIISHLASLDNYTDALSNDISDLDSTVNGCTDVPWATSISLDWNVLGTRTVKIDLPLDMPTTTITASNIADGATYTLILTHADGGLLGEDNVLDPAVFRVNGSLTYAIVGDPGYLYIRRFVGFGGKLYHIAGLDSTIA